ncbi:cytochrome c [Sphingomonas sp. SM33]|uniref:Cytochrome c n=1 Tax=Sphingomonas telluris TaxID=2907998 RepID=A0ABS9VME1_9SPHN|nr:c-type cytochrome [Sphingomonas telluris]MCH8616139.1 cytochrome c [Sphingomonas telluris]
MAKVLRWTGYVLGLVLLLIVAAPGYVWFASNNALNARVEPHAEKLIPMQRASVEEGNHLLLTRACAECHGSDLHGAKFLDDAKIATLYAPNLTLVAKQATDQQLAQAIRQGVGYRGEPLLVMPSESYQDLTDAEVSSLIKAIRAAPAGGRETPARRVGPLGRIGLVAGKFKTAPVVVQDYANARAADLGPQFAAGRHIAVTVCSGCHGSTLSGKEAEPGTMAPDLTITGSYDLAAFTKLMRTGLPPSGKELKMMTGVSRKAFTHFTDHEIASLHGYLVERTRRAP